MWRIMFQPNRAFWQLKLTTGTSREFESRANYLARLEVLSYSVPASVTLQLPLHASHVCHFGDLPVANRKIQSWDSFELHTSWVFFTLFHTLPLHNSYLNTGYLIAKLQVNLARNKANTWLNKFNLTNYNGFSIKLVKSFQDSWSRD